MKNNERQLYLDTMMYANKSFGQEDYCKYCWACHKYSSCIAGGAQRSKALLCVKAENRMMGKPTETSFAELLKYGGERNRHYITKKYKKLLEV